MNRFLAKVLMLTIMAIVGTAGLQDVVGQQRKLDKISDKADKLFENGDYTSPITMYEEIQKYPDLLVGDEDVINFRLGYCYMHLGWDNEKALNHFERYLENDNELTEAYLYSGKMLQMANRFEEAIERYNQYAAENGRMDPESLLAYSITGPDIDALIASCERAKSFKKHSDENINVENMGEIINSKYDEYGPVLSPNGTDFILTKRLPSNLGGRVAGDGKFFEDIYEHKIYAKSAYEQWFDGYNYASAEELSAPNNGLWSVEQMTFSEGKRLGGGINSEAHDGAIQFAENGNSIYFFRYGKIYKTSLNKKGEWAKPKLRHEFKGVLDVQAFEPSLYIIEDGSMMFFSSDRPGGYGGLDIWISEKRDSVWSTPVNAGPLVNTSADEDAPRYLEKEKLLFFASKGHDGMGGYDIYLTQRSEGVWRKARNLGMPINSTGDDTYLIPGLNESSALFSSNRNWGSGGMDVYSVSFPTSLGEYFTTWKGHEHTAAKTIAINSLSDSKEVAETNSNAPVDPVVVKATEALKNGNVDALVEQLQLAVANNEELKAKLTSLFGTVKYIPQPRDSSDYVVINKEGDQVVKLPETGQTASINPSTVTTKKEASSNTSNSKQTGALFEIQIGAFNKPYEAKKIKSVTDYQVRKDGEWDKLYFGQYKSLSEANKDLERIKGLGFSDAFVVPYGYSVNSK